MRKDYGLPPPPPLSLVNFTLVRGWGGVWRGRGGIRGWGHLGGRVLENGRGGGCRWGKGC